MDGRRKCGRWRGALGAVLALGIPAPLFVQAVTGSSTSVSTADARGAGNAVVDRLNRDGAARGVFDRESFDPRGRPNGLLLRDGTWVEASSSQSARAASLAQPGDEVWLGYGPASTVQVRVPRTGALADLGPLTFARGGGPNAADGPARAKPDVAGLSPASAGGSVRYVFRGLNGKPAGVVLSNDTQVYLPHSVADVLEGVHPGEVLTASGYGTPTPGGGLSMWATRVTRGSGQPVLRDGPTR